MNPGTVPSRCRLRFAALAVIAALLKGCQERPGPAAAKPAPPPPAIHEPFAAEAGRPLMGSVGGTGLGQPWDPGGFNAQTAHNYRIAPGSLTYPGLAVSGNCVSTAEQPAITGLARPLGYLIGVDGTRRYLSVLIRPDGTLHQGAWNGFFGLSLMSSADLLPNRDSAGTFAVRMQDARGAELFLGKPGEGRTNTWVMENRGGENQISSGTTITAGTTALLVLRMDFSVIGDTFTLHVNPVPGQPEPTNGVVKTDTNLGIVDRLVLYSTGAWSADEIRIGETFESVTPPASP